MLEIPSGQRYELCRSVHAEQNAIINAARAGVSLLKGTMYLFSEKMLPDGESQSIDATPCFICKKIIINAGLDRFVGQQADGTLLSVSVLAWVNDWLVGDMLDDKAQYGERFSAPLLQK